MSSPIRSTFDIHIGTTGAEYIITIDGPNGRRLQLPFSPPFQDEYQVKYYISEATRLGDEVRRGLETRPLSRAKEMGELLFHALFTGEARYQLDSCINQIDQKNGLLCVRLNLTDAPELAALPWEYLFHPDRHFFLTLSPDVTFVRYIQSDDPIPPTQVELPLRMLAMACSPADLPPLNVELERQRLEESLQNLITAKMLEIDWLEENSLSALNAALDEKRYHIFHFVGHGAFFEEEKSAAGILLFEDEARQHVPVSAEQLGWVLRRSVRLALINACEGARSLAGDPSTGVASSLLHQGLSAVVAMQFEISDKAAIRFAYNFYSGIALGLPVDEAMTRARRDIMTYLSGSNEWATPVLFLRTQDGQIFDLADLKPVDAATARAQEVVYREASQNLELDVNKFVVWMGNQAQGVLDNPTVERFFGSWSMPGLGTGGASLEDLYKQAQTAMQEERWEHAIRCFRRINNVSPGYRNIVPLWQESERQFKLADLYRRLVNDYVAGRWQQVIILYQQIYPLDADYREAAHYYADACNKQGLHFAPSPAERPSSLPPSTGGASIRSSARPSTLPGQRPSDKPTSLPGARPKSPPDTPPSLPP